MMHVLHTILEIYVYRHKCRISDLRTQVSLGASAVLNQYEHHSDHLLNYVTVNNHKVGKKTSSACLFSGFFNQQTLQ